MENTYFTKKSPFNNEILYNVKNYKINEIISVTDKAKNSFQEWKKTTFEERITKIRLLLDLILKDKEKIIKCICTDVGKPYVEAETEVLESYDIIRFYIEQSYDILSNGLEINLDNSIWHGKKTILKYEPIGVYAVIKPWNYPFELPIWSIIPILIAGNTIVFKPSEYSTKTGQLIFDLFLNAGFPEGVFNIITGDGSVGKFLVRDTNINAIDFTGSQNAGKNIYESNSTKLKKINLELGGSDFAIVCDNSDIDLAVDGLLWGAFSNAGQVCVSTEKILIHKSMYELFKRKYIEKVSKLCVVKEISPLISEEKLQSILNLVDSSIKNGCKLLIGGKKVTNNEVINGNFLYPTVLECENIDYMNTLPELFAPIVYLGQFENYDEIERIINKSSFGLGCTVWSKSVGTFERIANNINCGMVWLNEVNLPLPQVPWNGIKDSGMGFSLSFDSVKNSMNVKVLNFDMTLKKREWWYPYKN